MPSTPNKSRKSMRCPWSWDASRWASTRRCRWWSASTTCFLRVSVWSPSAWGLRGILPPSSFLQVPIAVAEQSSSNPQSGRSSRSVLLQGGHHRTTQHCNIYCLSFLCLHISMGVRRKIFHLTPFNAAELKADKPHSFKSLWLPASVWSWYSYINFGIYGHIQWRGLWT